jgi:pilus assembly protein Flp/PilA
MTKIGNYILRLRVWKDTSGQDLVEYALIAGLIAVVAVASVTSLGTTITNMFSKISSTLG